MRFLKFSFPGSNRSVINLYEGANVISLSDKSFPSDTPEFFKKWITILGGFKGQEEIPAVMENCDLILERANPVKQYKLSAASKKIFLYTGDEIHNNFCEVVYDKNDPDGWPFSHLGLFSMEEMLMICVHDSESVEHGDDPIFKAGRMRKLLLKKDLSAIKPLFASGLDGLALSKEKELNVLLREIQLLELKKMKKDRLKKEISQSARKINKLSRQINALDLFRTTLYEIRKKTEQRDRLAYKISEIRRDLMELKEIGDKIHSLEKDLKKRFPHFYSEFSEDFPDMDRMQEAFNSVRDCNEKIDGYYQNKKRVTGRIMKWVVACCIFIFLSVIFITIKSKTSGTASIRTLFTITSVIALLAGAGYLAVVRINGKDPVSLMEEKKQKETLLLELLHENNFPVGDFKTAELYDFLFQYFEDFISFRDIRNELAELRKNLSGTAAFTEKERKLDNLQARMDEVAGEIREMLSGLDGSVHPVPDLSGIDDAVIELNESINDLESMVEHEKLIMTKLEEQLNEVPGTEVNPLEIEAEINGIGSRIEALKEETEAVKFIEEVFSDAAEPFLEKRMPEFTGLLDSMISLVADNHRDDHIKDAAESLFSSAGLSSELDMNFRLRLSLAVRATLSVYFGDIDLPPVVLVDPFSGIPAQNVAAFHKILLELFSGRQVIIFTSGSIAGNN